MKVGIFIADSNGCYPVPASRGGAISGLVENLIKENNKKQRMDMEIVSYYDKRAEILSKQYPNISFQWVKVPKLINTIDKGLFFLVKNILKKGKAVSFKSLFSLGYYILCGSIYMKIGNYNKVILENNIPMALMIKLSGFKGEYYYHFHNVPRIDAGCRTVFSGCKNIFCISEFVAKQICGENSAIGKIEYNKIKIYHNCIDEMCFNEQLSSVITEQYRKKLGISKKDKVVLFVGRMSAEKGIDQLLNAVELTKVRNIKVVIVGSYYYSENIKDEYQNKLHEMAKKMDNKIIFAGYIGQDELPYLYSASDIVVLPSMWEEPAGLTMIEALACGKPVITTKSGGIPEYMGDCAVILEKNGSLPADIALAIDKLLTDKQMYQLYSEKGIKRVKENFTKAIYLERLCEILK